MVSVSFLLESLFYSSPWASHVVKTLLIAWLNFFSFRSGEWFLIWNFLVIDLDFGNLWNKWNGSILNLNRGAHLWFILDRIWLAPKIGVNRLGIIHSYWLALHIKEIVIKIVWNDAFMLNFNQMEFEDTHFSLLKLDFSSAIYFLF